jgi:tRNA(Arg) A34 adenosine deaminase TadA
MANNLFKAERDALAFLGLMSRMFQNFDVQFTAPDGELSHTRGLNIHAVIIDNATGQVLGMQQNNIHEQNNPLLHAEQLTLKEAIERKNETQPIDPATTSVESYYRNLLFNDPNSYDALKNGATIYTTLEPCPFCTSALLVSRVKRIVYITPDSSYGNSFYILWTTFYKKYDIHYEQLTLPPVQASTIVTSAKGFLESIMKKVEEMKNSPKPMASTLYFDFLKTDLELISNYFRTIAAKDLATAEDELANNTQFLEDLKKIC